MRLLALTLITLCGPHLLEATKVKQCKGVQVKPPVESDVSITDCETPPCKLKKKTAPVIEMKFTPDEDADQVISRISAEIFNVPFPFIGMDGVSACDRIFKEDGTTPAGCPVKAGQTYVYRNAINVLEIYPKVNPNVHWGLVDPKRNQHISCFEVATRIV